MRAILKLLYFVKYIILWYLLPVMYFGNVTIFQVFILVAASAMMFIYTQFTVKVRITHIWKERECVM